MAPRTFGRTALTSLQIEPAWISKKRRRAAVTLETAPEETVNKGGRQISAWAWTMFVLLRIMFGKAAGSAREPDFAIPDNAAADEMRALLYFFKDLGYILRYQAYREQVERSK